MVTRTTNFYLAAVFLAQGAELKGVDKSDLRHLKFEFDGIDLSQLEWEWDHHVLMVNARKYSEAIKDIKLKIHQATGE